MNDPLTASERVQFNTLQRKVDDHRKQSLHNLGTWLEGRFGMGSYWRDDFRKALLEDADQLIPLLQPFATNKDKT